MCFYYSFRTSIAAHWFGFHDPHSGLHHFEWCVGTTVGDCDVIEYETIHKSTIVSKAGVSLPTGTPLFMTVMMFNNVNMNSTRTSNAFIVDETPPEFTTAPIFDMTGVGLFQDYQIDRSQVI